MGLFGKSNKDKHASLSELQGVAGPEITTRKLSDKEIRELTKKARGEVSKGGDIKAGASDFLKGRKPTISPVPQPRKGRSMWGKDTPLK